MVCDAGETVADCPGDCGSTCGNGVVESGEQCDNGASNGSCPASCSSSCQNNSCGGGGPTITLTISGVTTTDITHNSATVSWTTNDSALCQVAWGLNTDYSVGLSGEIAYNTAHSSSLTGLTGGTEYYFKIDCSNTTGGTASSLNNTFTTQSAIDVTPPANVSGLRSEPDNTIINLYWTNPTDNDFAGVKIRRSLDGFPTLTEGVLIYDGLGNPSGDEMTFEDTGLTNGTLYYYTIFAYDTSGNHAGGASISDRPTALENVIGLRAISSDRQVALYWQNPVYSGFSGVAIRRSLDSFPGLSQGSLVYQGLGNIFGAERGFIDAGLTNDVDYFYTVFTFNNLGDYSGGSSVLGRPFVIVTTTPTTTPPIEPPIEPPVEPPPIEPPPGGGTTTPATTTPPIRDLYFRDFLFYQHGSNFPVVGDSVSLTNDDGFSVLLVKEKVLLGTEKIIMNLSLEGKIQSYIFSLSDNGYTASLPTITAVGRYSVSVIVLGANNQTIKTISGWLQIRQPEIIEEVIVPQIIADNIIKPVTQLIKPVQEIAQSTAGQSAAAVAVAISAANVIVATPWWNLWYLLQFLFTQPFQLFRKRKGWGTVYNSITKKPVDLALVRLYEANSHKLIASKVTDRFGRYIFLVDAGRYYLKVEKPNFDFPSALLKDRPDDGNYSDLYYGKEITIGTGERAAIVANIPLDQQEIKISNQEALKKFSRQRIFRHVSWIGPIVAVVYFAFSPSWYAGLLVMLHLFLLWYFRRLALKKKGGHWGKVFDKNSRKPIKKAVTRIFSSEYGRMLEFYVTDNSGRYGFLVGDNKYYVTADKDDYQTAKTPIVDLTGKTSKEQKIIAQDIGLVKAQETDIKSEPMKAEILSEERPVGVEKPIEIPKNIPLPVATESKPLPAPANKEAGEKTAEMKTETPPQSFDLGSIGEIRESLNIAPETEQQEKKLDWEDKK